MDNTDRTIIEVNGVKLEVDMRYAKRIDELRVGDRVKVLTKPSYGEPTVYPGVIVGFEPFPSRPTIIVSYLVTSYSGAEIKFVYINSATKDVELVKSVDDDLIDKEEALQAIDREIEKKRREMADLQEKRAYFLRNYAVYWTPVKVPAEQPED